MTYLSEFSDRLEDDCFLNTCHLVPLKTGEENKSQLITTPCRVHSPLSIVRNQIPALLGS